MPSRATLLLSASILVLAAPARGQGGGQSASPFQQAIRAASRLDGEGRHAEARAAFQQLIDSASTPAERASAQRRMAMSYAFEGNCARAIEYEEQVIAYWVTREAEEPQNAFYQQGEMANEAARVCADAGALDEAERMYRRGRELGLREPEPRTHPVSLWDYRLAHALARISARRGDHAEAGRQVAAARAILDRDTAMAREQERFFPYLQGYVAYYAGDLAAAESAFTRALAMEGNRRDPFQNLLLAMTYEKQGRKEEARVMYQKAYELAGGHNPPAAHSRPYARRKLAEP